MCEIIKFIVENEIGKLLVFDEQKLFAYISVIDGVIKRDLQEIIHGIRVVKDELELPDSGYVDLLQALIFVTNKMPINDEEEKIGLIIKSTNVITKWISDMIEVGIKEESSDERDEYIGGILTKKQKKPQINLDPTELKIQANMRKEEFIKPIRALLRVSLSIIHGNYGDWLKELKEFLPAMVTLIQSFTFVKDMNEKLFDEGVPIRNFSEKTLMSYIHSINTIFRGFYRIKEEMSNAEVAIYNGKRMYQTINIPMSFYEGCIDVFGRSESYNNKFLSMLSQSYNSEIVKNEFKIIMSILFNANF